MTNTSIESLLEAGCATERSEKLCRTRGGESCAFDGAMIVLQPIADTAHLVHGPISCCGSSWEGRGTLSSQGELHRMGFTTDMGELDIVYGAEGKLAEAIISTNERVRPSAIFVYATCVSGLIGEDIAAVCKKAGKRIGIPVIPVSAPGFVGPKNLGNRIAGEALLNHVIGRGEPPLTTDLDINLIGEYNIAGDLWLVEPLLQEAGIRILSRMTGNATFQEITWAHRAKLNVLVCSRALINVAREMERLYGMPYVEVSFFGKTEMSKALRAIVRALPDVDSGRVLQERVELLIEREESLLTQELERYRHLRGKRAVLYTGGVKSWSFIAALLDLGIEVVAVGTKKSTAEDEEKMKHILGEDAVLVEDVTPKNLLRLLKQRRADMLVAGGRNLYLAVKEGYPFIDVNQERHTAYAGYRGLLNVAEHLSNSLRFYERTQATAGPNRRWTTSPTVLERRSLASVRSELIVNPLKHSQAIGACVALQGFHRTIPLLHGAQGCNFLGKVLITKHFREPIAMVSSKLFAEDVIMGGEERLIAAAHRLLEKNKPKVLGVLTSALCDVKGDDVAGAVSTLQSDWPDRLVLHIPTPDYEGGLETGYAKAVAAVLDAQGNKDTASVDSQPRINVLAGAHLTPADFLEVRRIVESFGLMATMIPDLAALDGSRKGVSALALGGTTAEELTALGSAVHTIAIGPSLGPLAKKLHERVGVDYSVFDGLSALADIDLLAELLSQLSGQPMPDGLTRERSVLVDTMRDAHFHFGGKRVCIALEPDAALQASRWLDEAGALVELSVVPQYAESIRNIVAREVVIGDFSSIKERYNLLMANSHGQDVSHILGMPLYQAGFPVYKIFGYTNRLTVGYRGAVTTLCDVANLLSSSHS